MLVTAHVPLPVLHLKGPEKKNTDGLARKPSETEAQMYEASGLTRHEDSSAKESRTSYLKVSELLQTGQVPRILFRNSGKELSRASDLH